MRVSFENNDCPTFHCWDTEAVPVDTKVFHYTSFQSFEGIVKNNCLWATNIKYLNDPTEEIFGIDQAKNLVKEIITACKDKEVTEAFQKSLEFIKDTREHIFTISLSDCPDNSEMWKSYGRNEGVCIEFDLKNLYEIIRLGFEQRLISIGVKKVVYGEDQARIDITNIILDMIKNSETNIVQKLGMCYEFNKHMYKDDCFSYEKEIRLVVDIGICDELFNKYKSLISYRDSNTGKIPYIQAPYNNIYKLPIKAVTISPFGNKDILKDKVENTLASNGYNNVDIKFSKL